MNQNITDFLDWHASQNERKKTVAGARIALERFGQWLKDRPIGPDTLAAYRAHLFRQSLEESTKREYTQRLRQLVRWLCTTERIHFNYDRLALNLQVPPSRRKQPEILQRDELARLFETCGKPEHPRIGALTLLAFLVPERREDLTRLPVRDFKLDHEVPHVILNSNKVRMERAMELKWAGQAGLNLCRRIVGHGRVPPYRYRDWQALREAAGLPGIQFKHARACWDSYARAAGVCPPAMIDRILGHTAEVAAARYTNTLLIGVSGQDAPHWYGCPEVIGRAVDACVLE